jgi:gliding motility-associated-like protein
LSDTIIKQIIVSKKPTATITNSTPTCFNSPVTFTGISLMAVPDTLKNWIWDFGDNTTATSTSGTIQHNYQDSTFYSPSVILVSNSGCKDTVQLPTIEVSPKPLAGFISPDACLLEPFVQFTDTTRFPQNTVPGSQQWQWTFGDGSSSPQQNPQHVYTTVGYKNVKLWVTNQSGCKDSVTQTFYIGGAKPDPGLNLLNSSIVCDKDSVYIKNTSTISLGDIIKVKICWDTLSSPFVFETDNTPLLNQVYAHKYPRTMSAETYYIKLIASSGGICMDSTQVLPLIVHPNPAVNFSQDKQSACFGDVIRLTDLSIDYEGGLQNWNWNMGDNNVLNQPNINYSYTSPGEYNISFFVTGSNGCLSDTLNTRFKVYPYPDVQSGGDQFVLEGNSITLPATINGNDVSFIWTPAQYLNNPTLLNPICTPTDDITYTLLATSEGGCRREERVKVTVLKVPGIPNTFSPNNDGINDKWVIKYLEQYPYAKVQVFTRTGQLVFESLGYKNAWDGRFNGKALPVDTYYFVIEPESGRKPVTGYVTIIK